MRKIVAVISLTLDGVMQAPGRPDAQDAVFIDAYGLDPEPFSVAIHIQLDRVA